MPPMPVDFNFDLFMQGSGWAWFSLVSAAFSAGFYLVNQYFRQPGDLLVFLMRVFIIISMTPFVTQLNWPSDPHFYMAVGLTVLLGTGSDVRTFNASAKYGGGMVSRMMPVTVLGAFFLWFFVQPSLLAEYISKPMQALGIVASLALCVYCAMRLNRCDISRAAMVHMAPALCGYTLTTLLNKYAMDLGADSGSYTGVVYGYMYVQSILAVLCVGPYILWQRRARPAMPVPIAIVPSSSAIAPRALALAALMVGLVWIAHMIFKNYAMAYTENPSYQAAINLTAPVMIALIYRIVGHREDTDVVAGMGIVLSALLLVVVTAY